MKKFIGYENRDGSIEIEFLFEGEFFNIKRYDYLSMFIFEAEDVEEARVEMKARIEADKIKRIMRV